MTTPEGETGLLKGIHPSGVSVDANYQTLVQHANVLKSTYWAIVALRGDTFALYEEAQQTHADLYEAIEALDVAITNLTTTEDAAHATLSARIDTEHTKNVSQDMSIAALVDQITILSANVLALTAAVNAKKDIITLPDVVVPSASLIQVALGPRTFNDLACAGLRTTDTLVLSVKSLPANFGLRAFTHTKANMVSSITLQCPIAAVAPGNAVFAALAIR